MNILQGPTGIPTGGIYDFGNRLIDSHTGVTFTIENTGSGNLNLTGTPLLTISGTNADQFQITGLPSTPIMPGSSTTSTIQFSPTSLGIKTAIISIPNTDSDENPYEIRLSGDCAAGLLFSTFDQDTIDQPPPLTGLPYHPTSLRQVINGPGGPTVDGTINVRSAVNGITTQAVEINGQAIPDYYFGSVQYNLGTTISTGIVILEATIAVSTVLDAADYGFFIDTGSAVGSGLTRLWIYGSSLKAGGVYGGTTIGTYQANVPFRIREEINLDTQRYSVVIDNELNGFADDVVYSGLTFMNTGTLDIRNIYASSCPYNIHQPFSCAYDDIYVGYIPSGGYPTEALAHFDESSGIWRRGNDPRLIMSPYPVVRGEFWDSPFPNIGASWEESWSTSYGPPWKKSVSY
jgi:hypothetical protein